MSDHPGLAWLRESEDGSAWLDRLPRLVEECADRWSLAVGEPFANAFASLALSAARADGSGAVLKIQFPDHESELEAAALELLDGDGAVRLIEYDLDRRALLLERCRPGTALKELLDIFSGDVAANWAYSRALLFFQLEGHATDMADQALSEALAANPHVPSLLLGEKPMPRDLPDFVGLGDMNEAVDYVSFALDAWRQTSGALLWLSRGTPAA